MRRIGLAVGLTLALAPAADAQILINEVYTGGGSGAAGTAYLFDFIELFNAGPTAADISGYVLAYGTSAQPAGSFPTAIGTIPAATSLAPGAYYVVQTGSTGSAGAPIPNVNFTPASSASLSNTAGGVRLQDAGALTLDVLGWGTALNFEGTAETQPASTAISMQRVPNGLDTNNNQSDFSQFAPTPGAFNAVPEPTSLALCGLAFAGFAGRLLRRKKA